MELISHRIEESNLKPGDHIYSWRTKARIYAHHGIYIGGNEVIHFTNSAGRGKCGATVVCTSLDCFLAGGNLYRYKYAVTKKYFCAKRGGTCTLAASDPDNEVLYRAKYLLDNGAFGCYNLFKNNCEDFALYCKTGLVAQGQSGQSNFCGRKCLSGQINKFKILPKSAPKKVILATPLVATVAGPKGLAVLATYGLLKAGKSYIIGRYEKDIGVRTDVVKVPVEDVARGFGVGVDVMIVPVEDVALG